ncbi:uncharacterized protein [Cicer arietinum]|uniref:uncharacterized protein n=1 Tax=Cicer arietinum TaxID=3827 RepID=UPI00032A8EDB
MSCAKGCSEEKTIYHCLICPQVVDIWISYRFNDVQMTCHDICLENVPKILRGLVRGVGLFAMLIMCYIWISRNKFVFDGTHPIRYHIVIAIFPQLHVAHKALGNSSSHPYRPILEMSWTKVDVDTMVLSVDDNALTNSWKTSFGGMVQNHDGDFQFGFYGSVKLFNILHA